MINILKKLLLLILLTCLIMLTETGCDEKIVGVDVNVNNTNYSATEPITYNIAVVNHSKLRLEGINGDITISGRPGLSSVIINSEKKVSSESVSDAESHLQDLSVTLLDLGDEIFVKTSQPDENYGRIYVVDYDITIPDNFKVLVNNINGSIQVDSLNNSVTIIGVNGSAILNDIFGTTVVTLVNGQIESKQSLPLHGTISFTTVNGSIELDIPQSTSANFNASVVNGNINLSNLILQNEYIRTGSISGTLGSGEGTISLITTNGTIYVTGY